MNIDYFLYCTVWIDMVHVVVVVLSFSRDHLWRQTTPRQTVFLPSVIFRVVDLNPENTTFVTSSEQSLKNLVVIYALVRIPALRGTTMINILISCNTKWDRNHVGQKIRLNSSNFRIQCHVWLHKPHQLDKTKRGHWIFQPWFLTKVKTW